jgi:hypothetical protein
MILHLCCEAAGGHHRHTKNNYSYYVRYRAIEPQYHQFLAFGLVEFIVINIHVLSLEWKVIAVVIIFISTSKLAMLWDLARCAFDDIWELLPSYAANRYVLCASYKSSKIVF